MEKLTAPKITINEKSYKVSGQIGEGAFAFVFAVTEAKLIGKSEKFAVKKMICQSEEQLQEAMNEVKVMKSISSPFTVPLLDYEIVSAKGQQTKEVFMLLPLCSCSLQGVIDSGGRKRDSAPIVSGISKCSIDEDDVILSILLGAAKGLKAVHDSGHRHADFKPANILLCPPSSDSSSSISSSFSSSSNYPILGWVPLVTDFGSATPLEMSVKSRSDALKAQDYASVHTTASFRAPELFDTPHPCIIDGRYVVV